MPEGRRLCPEDSLSLQAADAEAAEMEMEEFEIRWSTSGDFGSNTSMEHTAACRVPCAHHYYSGFHICSHP
jgi:hypothetical protein